MLEKWKYIPDKSGFVCACSWTSQIFSRRCYFFHEKPVYENLVLIVSLVRGKKISGVPQSSTLR